ncbi:MAG: potassium transporter Kup [Pyrinomonadaceae bacterium]|nr:potassium transporter Kup [Pyrinomonadaceae bacterium]
MDTIKATDIHTTSTGEHLHRATPTGRYLALLSLTALGVVYGDIGTSPLYALRECFHGTHGIEPSPANIFGVLSLIFWALIIIITIKYCVFVLRADNHGEGGILALTALATPIKIVSKSERWWIVVFGIFGAALLYGDGIITPAISVLDAVEGLNVATKLFESYVVPITIAILIGLFLIQSRGTAKVGKLFGPIMLVWFFVIALLGVMQIVRHPSVVGAFNPVHGFDFFMRNGWHGFLVLGTVFLVVTGGEALYADMGHFGKKPIRIAWFALVLPALMLNYLGQGALLLENPTAKENPFYLLAPEWALYPMIVLATCAAVIASQALISGAYSLTMQAIQLGFIPRLKIEHTSSTEMGQIYIPALNWALMIGCIAIVIGFRTSSNLAAAYGIAVTSTMVITTILLFVVEHEKWGWSLPVALLLSGFFLVIDLAFFGANVIKIPHGGWFPLVVGAAIFTLMTTWKKGRRVLAERLLSRAHPISEFLRDIAKNPPARVPGTAVFMNGTASGTPPALMHNLEHNKVLHERVVLLTVKTKQTPHVEPEDRVQVESLGHEFYRMIINYGFMEDPDIPEVLENLKPPDPVFNPMDTTYFLGRETVIASKHPGMMIWREKMFALMSRNASTATAYFCLPPNRVVELGSQVEI